VTINATARDLDRVIKKYVKENFEYPSKEWLLENTGYSNEVLELALKNLVKLDDEMYDFYIKNIEPKPSIDSIGKPYIPKEKSIQLSDRFHNFVKKSSNGYNTLKKIISNINFLNIFIFVAFITGIITSIIRVNISSIFFQTMFDSFWAFMFALAWVLFAIISFEAIFLFKEKQHWTFFGISIFLCVIVTGFSMISTTKALYDVMIIKESKNSIEAVVNQNNVDLKKRYEDQLIQYKQDKQASEKSRDYLQSLLEKETDPKSYNFRDLNIRLAARKQEINNTQIKIDNIESKLEKLLIENKNTLTDTNNSNNAVNTNSKLTFVQAVSKLFNWQPNAINLMLTIFPAVFLDFMPPFCFAVVLFIGRKDPVVKVKKSDNIVK
jgi:hypothetical protein